MIGVSGSIAFDNLMEFAGRFCENIMPEKLHMLNVSLLVHKLERHRGGCAANIAYGCALGGLRPIVVGAAGADFGSYREWLDAQGIDTRGVRVFDDAVTATCFITSDRDRNQITFFYPGAMSFAGRVSIAWVAGICDLELAIISPNHPAAMGRHADECRRLGVPFVFDPGQQTAALDGDAIRAGIQGAKALVVNEYELAVVQEKTGLALAGLLERCEIVATTLGARGVRLDARGGASVHVPAAPVPEVVDATGAGDAFRGGFLRGLVSGASLEVIGRMGAVAAAYCVETPAPTSYRFTPEEFAARYEEAYGDPLPCA